MILDIHTHADTTDPRRVVNYDPTYGAPLPAAPVFSAGIHPWNADRADLDALRRIAPRAYAIGEAGLDKLCGPSIDVQVPVFVSQARLADELGKPLIIHCVKAWPELIAVRRSLQPTTPWIIHGFRGKPELAQQLLREGFDISLGEKFNPATRAVIPDGRLYTETDESPLSIDEIRRAVGV